MKFKEIVRCALFFAASIINRNRFSKVLYYHDVGCKYTDMGTPFEIIKKHISTIRKHHYDIVSKITQREDQIMIAFDDGWAGIYDFCDYFVKENIFPTIFIAIDLIGKVGYLNVDQIKEMSKKGFIFECHTWSHYDLTTYSAKELEHELKDSKLELMKCYGASFDSICFPQGRFSDLVIKKSLEAGYNKLYSSISGYYYELINQGIICRNLVQSISPKTLGYLLEGGSKLMSKRNLSQHYEGKCIIVN